MADSRRPRLSRNELRTLFIDTGRTILREEGLGCGERLTFKQVCERVLADTGIRVTNASLIGRVWENQFEYQTDVLETIAADDSNVEVEDSLNLMAPFLASMDVSTEESRQWTVQELCRVVSATHLDTLRRSTDWALWVGILAVTTVGTEPERLGRINEALKRSYLDVTEQMERIYSLVEDLLGYRMRAGLTMRQFAIAAAALTEGCVLRDRVDGTNMNGIMRPTGRDGEEKEWTLFGLALEALVHQFFELDPDWVPPNYDAGSVSEVTNG